MIKCTIDDTGEVFNKPRVFTWTTEVHQTPSDEDVKRLLEHEIRNVLNKRKGSVNE